MTDTDMLYMASLEKRNAELEARVAELEEKHWNECGQIAHYSDENAKLKELREIFAKVDTGAIKPKDYLDLLDEWAKARKLLKAAVEDLRYLESHTVDEEGGCLISEKGAKINCQDCPLNNNNTVLESKCKWNYEAEALALIGEDTNVPASADDTNVDHKSGGWISCKDNMPDTLERGLSTMYSDCCLVCDAFGWVGMAYYITDGQKSWWEFADAQNKVKIDWTEVTHWMPLPDPPKDGEQNE